MTLSPEERASRSADMMWKADRASQGLGMKIEAVGEGWATLSMVVEKHHTNGLDVCHGGFLFTLADSAFAFACNSRNQYAIAQGATINFLRPGKLGDRLVASAREVHLGGRSGLYDVSVHRQGGELVVEFRGQSRLIPGQHFTEEERE